MHVGFAVAQPHLIEALRRVKDSFNVYALGHLALKGAVAAWTDRDWFDSTRQRIVADRDRTADDLEAQGFHVLPSAADFVFVSHKSVPAAELVMGLRSRGILVRLFDQHRIRNWLRISIGTSRDCDRLLEATRDIIDHAAAGTV